MGDVISNHVKDFAINLGPVTTYGSLKAVRKSEAKAGKPKFHYAAPDGVRVEQRYLHPGTGELFEVKELRRVQETPEGDKLVDQEELAQAKEGVLPKDVLTLSVYNYEEVIDYLWPSKNNAYVFYPHVKNKANVGWSLFLRTAVSEPGLVFLGMSKIKTANEAVYRLTTWRGRLVVQHMCFPAELNDHEVDETLLEGNLRNKAIAKARSLVEPFDPAKYRDLLSERLSELGEGQPGEVKPKAVQAEAEFDLDAALDLFDMDA